MKKALALLLVLVMCLSLAACGKSDEVINVETLIDRIGTVTLESEQAILKAEKAYDELYAQDQDKVDNRKKLIAAREKYEQLLNSQPVNCIQIDTITADGKTYDLSYHYLPDGLIQQLTITNDYVSKGTTYTYEYEYNFTYDEDGLITDLIMYRRALVEDFVNERDYSDQFSPYGERIYSGSDDFVMDFDKNGFVSSAKIIRGGKVTDLSQNTYDLDLRRGIIKSAVSNTLWSYPEVEYNFSIIQVPKNTLQTNMNIMSSILFEVVYQMWK